VGRLYAPNALAFALAFVTKKRWDDVNKGYLAGAPELVIEILSPSGTKTQIREYAALCLANGQSVEYSKGMAVPLALLGDASLGVDPIFG
jgi:hypothetical protein